MVVDAIKLSEDQTGVILRYHETLGANQKVTVKANFAYTKCEEVNLVEDYLGDVAVENNAVNDCLTPFEIRTLKFVL